MAERIHNLSAGQSDELAVNNRKLSEVIAIVRAQCEATVELNEELRIARAALVRLAEALDTQHTLVSQQLELLRQAVTVHREALAEMRRGRTHMETRSTPAIKDLTQELRFARVDK